MKQPTLIVMAAGMGSRYGGLKQMDPISSEGEIIIDFSLYDAMMAGFKDVIFVIKKEMAEDFRALIDDRAGRYLNARYAFQELSDLPAGYSVPEGRVKPWGTCHAVLSCREMVDGPFAVINADDFYGSGAFQLMYDFLENVQDGEPCRFSMIGYPLKNTLTEHGHVARGICEIDDRSYLKTITERTKIMWREGKIQYTEDETHWTVVPENALVSMNFWGFTPIMMRELYAGFPDFLDQALAENPLKAEYLLPTMVDRLLQEEKVTVKVLRTEDRWYGVTYQEDKPCVMDALQALKDKGLYPERLWR